MYSIAPPESAEALAPVTHDQVKPILSPHESASSPGPHPTLVAAPTALPTRQDPSATTAPRSLHCFLSHESLQHSHRIARNDISSVT